MAMNYFVKYDARCRFFSTAALNGDSSSFEIKKFYRFVKPRVSPSSVSHNILEIVEVEMVGDDFKE